MSKKNKSISFELPESCLLEISGTSKFGDFMAETVNPEDNPRHLKIYVMENRKIKPALTVGDKFISRMLKKKDNWFAKPVARTAKADEPEEILYGIIEKRDGKYFLKPSEKNNYKDYLIDHPQGASDGDFVKISLSGSRRFKEAEIIKNFGPFDLNKAAASLVLEKYKIPYEFPEAVLKESQSLEEFSTQGRENLTAVPLVTIDGDDSKDFDDAVYAQKTERGFLLIVAIADVAFYVRVYSELDKEAYKRGNSVYLPNMVVPMLPEELSNGVCSLRPKEARAAIACFIEIDNEGNIERYDFKRAVIKSFARLTYREVQEALDGKKSPNIAPVYNSTVLPVYEAYLALDKARKKRGALNLETDELKVRVNKQGQVIAIEKDERYTAHKIIEEFMVAANVCAALALKKSKLPTMYRVHEKPLEDKLKELEPLLHNLGLKLPDAPAILPEHFNKIIEMCSKDGEYNQGIGDLILRLQCQAKYSPLNVGHFGLGLKDYVHFTSPIRRYADLLIHRALIRAYDMPDGGGLEKSADVKNFEDIGAHLSETERKAVNAERDMTARFVSAYLSPSVGSDFDVKVSGVSSAGVFVRIENLGAEGLIPMSSLPADNYILTNGNMELTGETSHLRFCFGNKIKVRLAEASPITGGLIFKYIDAEDGIDYVEKGGSFKGGFQKYRAQMKGKKNLSSAKNTPQKTKRKKEKLDKKARKAKIKNENNIKKKRKKKSNAK